MGMSNENELRIPLESDNAQLSQEESAELHSSFHSETQSFIIDYKDDDVLLGRGKSNATHIGNIRFQGTLCEPEASFVNASSKPVLLLHYSS